MSHTPGPWIVNLTTLDGVAVRYHIAGPLHGSVFPICEKTFEVGENKDRNLADALLIAAAPDMYEALKSLLNNPHGALGDLVYQIREREGLGWDGPSVKAWSDAYTAAKTAIAKAEGK